MNSETKKHNSLISSDLIYFQHMNPENKTTLAWGCTFAFVQPSKSEN